MSHVIYKIEASAIWKQAQAAGCYRGSPLDVADGFIHLSSAHQVRETADKWFTNQKGLVLIHVDADALSDTLEWEASRDGALFPHNYGPLAMDVILEVVDMPLDSHGKHIFGPTIA